ncbi:M48 family metallopeptidase [Lysobacter solisilvae (ex Woo and Kim 2020)]|uniref:M48 family metallopeptidase n=1 Tax=Agrilutibacter terrestris TaxID=2865112 RepID=A0A7H0G118_9GAMM|nr:M48 family metallopeptidase [Lysobacter terrestris]QNP41984.1 M48 family metallopeptidase [Lysobacter terrestris]
MKRLLLVAAITTLLAGCATTTSPTGRRQVVGGVSEEQLAQLGAQAFAETKAKTPQSTDARQSAYVRCVVQRVVAQLPPDWQNIGWETAVFVDNSPNAFALPGGKVGVNTGIFTVAKNQDQLATVIAHEVGHVYSHHHNERITKQMGTQGLLQVAGALAGARYGQGVGNAVVQGGGIAAQAGFLLPNSREQESEADVVGQQLMARAGFDPRQAVNLWQNMIAASGGRSPEWLSTHPNPETRIRELNSRAASLVPVFEQARASGHTPKCG